MSTRNAYGGKLTGRTQIRSAVAADNQVFVLSRDAVSGRDKVPVVILTGEAGPVAFLLCYLPHASQRNDSRQPHIPGEDFGVIGFCTVVKRNTAFRIVSAGDKVCAGSVPIRHL